MQTPREPLAGMSLKELVMYNRAMHRFIMSQRLSGGPGIRVSCGPGGITLKGNPAAVSKRSTAGGSSGPFPFDVELVDLVPGTSKTASVRPGSVNNLIPSNYLTTYALLNSTTYFLIATVTTSGGVVTGVTLSMPTSAPSGMPVTAGGPPTSFTILIGVVIAGVWYRTIGEGSLECTSIESFRVDKASPSPGTGPYDIYYTWDVGNV